MMILIAQHPDGYALRRTDASEGTPPLIVDADELADAVAALFADGLDDYIATWDEMIPADKAASV